MIDKRTVVWTGLFSGLLSLVIGCYVGFTMRTGRAENISYKRIEKESSRWERVSKAFRLVAAKVKPAVVHIFTARTTGHSLWPEFFGQPRARIGQGSGVIVDSAKGYVLTNNHVVSGASEIQVVLSDRRRRAARLIGTDPKTDLAVLQISRGDLSAAAMGDSNTVEVGQWVLAIGNPFGLVQTVTAGIVSAKGRSNVGIAQYEDFLQTDCAINPGNSGGPLVNLDGKVVGINTAIFSKSGGYQGIGFAIPINMARAVMETLIARGKMVRGFLGVSTTDVDERTAHVLGRNERTGAVVREVVEGSPADRSGLMPGDLIVAVDSTAIENAAHLRKRIAEVAPGRVATLRIYRRGRMVDVKVRIADQDRWQ